MPAIRCAKRTVSLLHGQSGRSFVRASCDRDSHRTFPRAPFGAARNGCRIVSKRNVSARANATEDEAENVEAQCIDSLKQLVQDLGQLGDFQVKVTPVLIFKLRACC